MPSLEDIMTSGCWIYGRFIIGPRWTIHLLQLGSSVIVDGQHYYVSSYCLDFRNWAVQNIHVSTEVKSCFYRQHMFEAFSDIGIQIGRDLIRNGMIPVNPSLRNEYRKVWYKVLMDWGLPLDLAVKVISCILKNGRVYCSSPGSRRSINA
jgi:hypothetical protein